jgi:hypothetical protein
MHQHSQTEVWYAYLNLNVNYEKKGKRIPKERIQTNGEA